MKNKNKDMYRYYAKTTDGISPYSRHFKTRVEAHYWYLKCGQRLEERENKLIDFKLVLKPIPEDEKINIFEEFGYDVNDEIIENEK